MCVHADAEDGQEEEEEEESGNLSKKRKPWGDTSYFCPVALSERGVLWPGSEEHALRYMYMYMYIHVHVLYLRTNCIYMFMLSSPVYQVEMICLALLCICIGNSAHVT